jgi:hypothetical protein
VAGYPDIELGKRRYRNVRGKAGADHPRLTPLCLPAISVIICMDQLPKRRHRTTI